MADFLQAVKWMMEGKNVWRKGTNKIFHKTALVCIVDQDGNDFQVSNTIWFLAKDWEIHPSSNNDINELAVLGSILKDIYGDELNSQKQQKT